MADGLITAEANTLLDTLLAAYPYVQLHKGAPGAAGTANVAAGGTRESVSFNSASGGSASSSTDGVWTSVPTTETYSHASGWSAASAGSCGWTGAVTAPQVVAGDNFKLAAGSIVATWPTAS